MTIAYPGCALPTLGQTSAFLLALAVALIVAVAWSAWTRFRGREARSERSRSALRAEDDARDLLESEGYTVVDAQSAASWSMDVDGEPIDLDVRADLLVERDGRTFVAEVKTGRRAPDPTHPATRRQLLEYWLVFDVDGVLLVDMESRRIRTVRFAAGRDRR